MSARLTLLAHPATAATRALAFPADEPLDPAGGEQLAALANTLPRFRRLLIGPRRRLRDCAAALDGVGEVVAALDECDFGRWQGRAMADIAAAEPDAFAAWQADPFAAPHGGESVAALAGRVGGWLQSERDGGTMLAITHGTVLRAAMLAVLEAPPASFWKVEAPPLTRLVLSSDGRRWSLRALLPDTAA